MQKHIKTTDLTTRKADNLMFVQQMLGELRQVARREHADLLCYLIEMAYLEAVELQQRRVGGSSARALPAASIRHGKRN